MSAPQIELADNERRAANAAMRAIDCGALGNRPEQALDAAIETINRIRRLGAPVGTIKRSPEGYIAERREDTETGERHWASLTGWRHQGQSLSQADVDKWQTIYTPQTEPVLLSTILGDVKFYGIAVGGDPVRLYPAPPEPRVIAGRGLGSTERDTRWSDYGGRHWRFVHGKWYFDASIGGELHGYPSSAFAPYTEVIG